MTDKERIEHLERRVLRLEDDLARLISNVNKAPLRVYEPAPYWLNPDFKMPQAT